MSGGIALFRDSPAVSYAYKRAMSEAGRAKANDPAVNMSCQT